MNVEQLKYELYSLFPDQHDFLDEHIIRHFVLDDVTLFKIRDLLDQNISDALNPSPGKHSPLDLCPSYVCDIPRGEDTGVYIGIDLGGTNLRSVIVGPGGKECSKQIKSRQIPTEVLQGTGTELFDFIADLVYSMVEENGLVRRQEPIPLGFTFSFPVKQTSIDRAVLLHWTKNFACTGVVGKDVGQLLNDALQRKEGMHVRCVAIVNDTVSTLLSGALKDRRCRIGLICGTGTNACYFESPLSMSICGTLLADKEQVAIDTKWNKFGEDGATNFLRSEYDMEVNKQSTHSERMIFEKMMCSMYIGEITRLVLKRLQKENICFHETWTQVLHNRDSFSSKLVAEIVSFKDVSTTMATLHSLGVPHVTDRECNTVRCICQLVILRSASLTAACLACLVRRTKRKEVGIAADGSFFLGNEQFRAILTEKLQQLVEADIKPYFIYCQNGSGLGAAAAAVAITKIEGHKRP